MPVGNKILNEDDGEIKTKNVCFIYKRDGYDENVVIALGVLGLSTVCIIFAIFLRRKCCHGRPIRLNWAR